jgi:hypothetical protein
MKTGLQSVMRIPHEQRRGDQRPQLNEKRATSDGGSRGDQQDTTRKDKDATL